MNSLYSMLGVCKTYAGKTALHDISLNIYGQDWIGIIGKNGAGKTTLLKILIGLAQPDKGTFECAGNRGLSINFKKDIGFYLGPDFLPKELTGRQYLEFLNRVYHDSERRRSCGELQDLFVSVFDDLSSFDKQIKTYSLGMSQKIGICGALVHQPKLLILDEPFAGLDPISSLFLVDLLNSFKQKNTLIISSHDLIFVESICSNVMLLDAGSIKYYGTIADFTQNGENSLAKSFMSAVQGSNTTGKRQNWGF